MNELTAAVRRLIQLEALRMFAPLSASVAHEYAAAWLAVRAVLGPNFHGGRVEAISRDHALVRVERLLAAFRDMPAANDREAVIDVAVAQ